MANLMMPWMQFEASEWHAGRFPMWDPNSWTGQPLFGQGQPGAAYPLNWLMFWMPLNSHGWLRQDVLHYVTRDDPLPGRSDLLCAGA